MMKFERNRGITLVALVITVIILLILAVVAVSMITGNDGLFTKANEAASLYNQKATEEAEILNSLNQYIPSLNGGNIKLQNTSSLIEDFIPITSSTYANRITVDANIKNKENVKGYIYIVNGKVHKVSEDSVVNLENLLSSTLYKIQVIAIDINANIKYSSEEVEQWTPNATTVFANGMFEPSIEFATQNSKYGTAFINTTDQTYYMSASYSGNYSITYATQPIKVDDIAKIIIKYELRTDGGGITARFYAGMQSSLTKDFTFDTGLSQDESTTSTTFQEKEIELDLSNETGNKYFKFGIHHAGGGSANTACAKIKEIKIVYNK